MKTFRDMEGQEWRLALSIGDCARVKGSLGIDLLEPQLTADGQPPGPDGKPPPLSALLRADFLRFWDVLRVLVEPEAEKRGISAAEFGRRLGGEALHEAQQAFFDEWRDFFRGLGLDHQATVIEAHGVLMAKMLKLAATRAAKINPEAIDIERLMKKATPGSGSTASPARSASIRRRSRSGS